MQFCRKCGCEMSDDSLFCVKCGCRITESSTEAEGASYTGIVNNDKTLTSPKNSLNIIILSAIAVVMVTAVIIFIIFFANSGSSNENSADPENNLTKVSEISAAESADAPTESVDASEESEQSAEESKSKEEFSNPTGTAKESNTKEEYSKPTASASQESKVPVVFEDGIVVKSKNYKISYPLMQYLANYMYQNFCNTYGTSNFDTTKDLKAQYYDEAENVTWYDYFLEVTKNYITQIIVFAEGGKEKGLELTENDLKSLEQNFADMESAAAESGKSLDKYISELYGNNVTKADIEEIQKMTVLAQNYNNYLMDSFIYSDKDYEEYFQNNKNIYSVADFLVYNFAYNDETSKNKAKINADTLANAKNQNEFEEYLTKYLKDNNSESETEIEATHHSVQEYDDSNECYKWIFSEDRKENDITVIDENDAYNVILITKPLYRDESPTKSVRHILITANNDGSDEAAYTEAKRIYQEWKNGAATEDTFAQLAEKYSEDPGSNTIGGLYSNVPENYMVTEFNDWLFDSSRKVGDTDIVKTQFGYHIMYFVGEGLKTWQINVDNDLRQKDISEAYEKIKEIYTVDFDDNALKNMDLKLS